MRFLKYTLILNLLLQAMTVFASSIKTDEDIVFFTTAARLESGEWIVPVHAWVFEPEHNSFMRHLAITGLTKAFELDETAEESQIFRDRAKWFLVDNERGKYVMTSLSTQALGPTEANGHAKIEFWLDDQHVSVPSLTFTAVLPAGDKRIFNGEVFLIEPEGVSVISDIDDTIKISEVTDRKKLLENTFLKPFEAAPGMVDAYKRLAAAGMAFHYVSSSPWQLYPPLIDFVRSNNYPLGSFHLRTFRVKDETIFNVLKSSEITKPPVINKLLADYPKREFILIGDSGEKDPEIYGKIARENSDRIRHIYIRSITFETDKDERYKEAFKGLPRSLWTVFEDASVIVSEQ